MKLGFRSIVNAGNLKKERITLRVKSNTDVGDFLLARSGYVDDTATTDFSHTFWFPYKAVEQDDLIVLYTKSGVPKENVLTTGKTVHFYYWGLDAPIWGNVDHNRAVVLLHAPKWESKAVDDF